MTRLRQIIARILFKLFRYEFPIPEPAALRNDLHFGHYLTGPGQIEETRGSVNLIWVGGPWGDEAAIANMQAAQLPTVFDVSDHVYLPVAGTFVAHPDRAARLRGLLKRLDSLDLLQYLAGIVPIDEPNLKGVDENDVLAVHATARQVMAEFPALSKTALVTIYAHSGWYPGLSTVDWAGFDHYSLKSSIFTNGDYDEFEARLLPHQSTIIIPGGYQGQDPQPFIRFAHAHCRVKVVLNFLHADTTDFPGIRSIPNMERAYRLAGKQILARNATQ